MVCALALHRYVVGPGENRPTTSGPLTNYGSVAKVAEVTEEIAEIAEEKTVPKTLLRTKEEKRRGADLTGLDVGLT